MAPRHGQSGFSGAALGQPLKTPNGPVVLARPRGGPLRGLMTAGWFITFEGGEGSGKSTQAKRLAERLTAAGHTVTMTREPGGSPFAERLRAIILDPNLEKHSPLAEALLFASARADHLEAVIRPRSRPATSSFATASPIRHASTKATPAASNPDSWRRSNSSSSSIPSPT